MIEKLVLGEIWTGDLPIFNPHVLTSAPSRQALELSWSAKFAQFMYITMDIKYLGKAPIIYFHIPLHIPNLLNFSHPTNI